MKKIFSLLFVLLCTICSWAQTSISTYEELKSACATGGNVKLTADILLADRLYVRGTTELVLDLNGYTLDRGLTEYKSYGNVFVVTNSGKLIINDSSAGQTGKITGVTAFGVIILGNTATVIFNGGSICNNHCRSEIISTYSGNTATFIMNGGSIKDNIIEAEDDKRNSVIWCGENTTVKLYGGEISGNRLHQSDSDNYLPSCISVRGTEIGGTIVIKDNIVYEGTEESALGISNIDKIKISTTTPLADGAEIHVTGTDNLEIPGLTSDNVKYFVSDETGAELYCNEDGKLTVHTHSWATAWTKTDTHHYHACSATGCGMTDYSAAPTEAAYGTHVYGADITQTAYYTCSTCQYENATRKQEYQDAADAAAAAAVVAKINAIGTVEYTDASLALICDARTAYNALTAAQEALITAEQLKVLEDAEQAYTDLKAAAAVVEKIEAIGTVEYTDESLALISDARTAYNALTAEQKALITAEQLKVLEDAEQAYTDLKAVAPVVEKIEAIGTVELTPESKALIDDARAAYDALTEDQKALIADEDYAVLTDAEARYHELELMALAQPVIDLIDAIDTIDDLYLDAQTIAAARNAYDALIPEAQAYVTNYDALLEAEQKYSEMSDFYVYRNFRAIALGLIAQPAANLEVRELAVEAEQLLQTLEYEPELTLDQNKANVDEIYYIYRDAIRAIRKQAAKEAIYEGAKTAGKANIRLFLGLSLSKRAAAAAEEGIAAIDALEYDNDADIIANIDDVNDIVIDTKVAIVKAWIADFNAIRSAISASLRQTSADKAAEVEALSYDRNQTYDENVAKLNAFAQNEVTAIEAVGTTAARHNGKYIENGKIVIVKDGKTYTAGGQVK